MTVFDSIKDVSGCLYNNALHNRDILDSAFLRRGRQMGFRLPTGGGDVDRRNYWGAWVAVPSAGINRNVVYLDMASLYPSVIRAYNVSIDTLVGDEDDLADSQWSTDECIEAPIDWREVKWIESDEDWQDFTDPDQYKMVYDPDQNKVRWKDPDGPRYDTCYFVKPSVKEGFVTGSVEDWVDLKYQYEGEKYEAVKRITNSVYGFQAFHRSRLYSWELGESVTLGGRRVMKYTAEAAKEFFAERFDGDIYISHGDTDGVGIAVEAAPSRHLVIEAAMDFAEHANENLYGPFMAEEFDVDPENHYMEVEVESFAPAVFVPSKNPPDGPDGVKKRYAEYVTWDEGEEVDEISITGLEATRSDVAWITRTAQEKVLTWLLKEDRQQAKGEIFPYLRTLHEDIECGDAALNEIAKRGGIGQDLDEYGSENRRPSPIYRGAKYADEFVDGESLGEGSKPMAIYVKDIALGSSLPATYDADTAEDGDPVDCISVEDASNLPEDVTVDYDKHAAKALVGPMRPILQTMDWTWTDVLTQTEQTGFGHFERSA